MRDVNIRSEALSYRTYRENSCKNLVRKIVSRHSKRLAKNKKEHIKSETWREEDLKALPFTAEVFNIAVCREQ